MHHNFRFRGSYSIVSAFLLLLFCCGGNVFAQTGTSSVRGTVVDAQGNAVAGATVTLLNAEKNFNRTQTTNDQGGYTFTAVPPDTYRVEAEAANFKKVVVSDVRALVDTPTDIDVQLEVGAVTEIVDVSAAIEAPLNTTDASIGTTFESRRIEDLPLNARNIVNLLSLQPGVTRLGEVNGARRDQANVTLDGVDVNEQQSGLDVVTGDAFASVLRTTPDSVQEFRVTTSVPNANQGRSSGAQVSLVTKSGTNQFRGSLYEFHRNTATNANDFFNNRDGIAIPKLIRNLFGGTIGGPIVKDRLFFFYTYEGRRDAAEDSVLRLVPTAELRQGIVRYENTAGGITTLTPADLATLYPSLGGVNPAALTLLQTAPLPNVFDESSGGDGLNTAGFRFNAPTPNKLNTHIAKFDLNITDRQTAYFRGNYQDDSYGLAPQFPDTPAPMQLLTPKGFAAGHSWSITDKLVNTFRAGLTRQAFEFTGDSNENAVSFRFVYSPLAFSRAIKRTTPVFNITDDVSYVLSNHTVQFGANLRFIRNNRTSFATAYDTAIINPSFYASSGAVVTAPLTGVANRGDTRNAVSAVLGRFSQYSTNVNYDRDGSILPAGMPTARSFATEEYEGYVQDVWKIRPNLTLSYGLRYSIGTPVYERNGFQVKPTVSLGEFFERRIAGAEAGTPVNDLITVDLAGKANDRPGFYELDRNNFAPSVAIAYSPDFGDNAFGRALGRNGRSVFRGGFRQVYDRIGSALAVNFDLNNSLGFASRTTISANTFNVTTRPGPLLTGLGQDVRALPGLPTPQPISFPLITPADEQQRIEQTIDDTLTTPKQYTWNASYGRELPKGFSLEFSYNGRAARDLLVTRDVMHLNNIRDPRSGQTWYEAAGILADYRDRNTPIGSAAGIPFFENLFPGLGASLLGDASLTATQAAYTLVAPGALGGFDITDWTFIQSDDILDNLSTVLGPNAFFHPQYAALGVYSTVGTSDYHGGSVSLRQRFRNSFLFDINYTFAKSFDTGSNLESNTVYTDFLVQPLNVNAQRAVSDFDVRHVINANFLAELPFGRDRRFFSNAPKVLDAIFGGFQLTGVFRYNSGLPAGSPFDLAQWATNWNVQSNGVRLRNVRSDNVISDTNGNPNIFADPDAAYRSFRNARAGEQGARNILRIPSYVALDAGLTKNFKIGLRENDYLQFRIEAFNVTNTQRLTGISAFALEQDPFNGEAPAGFGAYSDEQAPVGDTNARPGRVFQFALRYVF